MKAYLLWIKSKIEFLNRQQTDSFNLCKEARSLINDIHANSITLQNLSLMNSVAENTKNDKFRKIIVYPYSSWSIQNLSSRLLEHISDLYQHRAQIHNSIIFLMQGVRLGLILAIPSIYLLFRSKLSNLQRISLTDSRITQENIKEEKLQNLHPVEFIARIFSMLLSPLINYSDSDSLDTVQRYDSFALSPQDVENLTGYINRSELCYSLLVLGDVLQVPDYYNQIEMPVAEQNYYKLGRSLLRPQFQGSCFKILRTLVLKKQGALVAKQRPGKDCIEMLSRAILELGCCENFIKPFFSLKLCCNNFFISPISAEELASCLLILSDALMRKGDSKTAIYISHQVESLPHFSHPTTIRHVNYLLAKERNISN